MIRITYSKSRDEWTHTDTATAKQTVIRALPPKAPIRAVEARCIALGLRVRNG